MRILLIEDDTQIAQRRDPQCPWPGLGRFYNLEGRRTLSYGD
jgi:hypothetical protein